MDLKVTHLNPDGLNKNPAFTQAIIVEGNARTIYIGGQNAVTADGQVVGGGDLEAQTEQVFKNMGVALTAAGATIHDVIKWIIYVVPGHELGPGFRVFQRAWGMQPNPPVISVVIVAGLANPDFLVELEAIAVTGGANSHAG